MKSKQTDRMATFEVWRKNNINNFGNFIWPQINYNIDNADIISIIFEEKDNVNLNIVEFTKQLNDIQYFILNFLNDKSPYYANVADLHNQLGLTLGKPLSTKIESYWDYRLNTKPKNCLTTDIDSLEIGKTQLIGIEATQLFDTATIDRAIPHIFRTFKFRVNQVNEKQYLAQHKFMKQVGGKAFILFHIIQNKMLIESNPVFLLDNNLEFYNMLCDIKNIKNEFIFIESYKTYLMSNLKQYNNIYSAYNYIKCL